MRRKFICGNWKMYKTASETAAFFSEFLPLVAGFGDAEIGVAPPLTSLGTAVAAAKGSAVKIGAQNVHWADEGAFTGEVSAAMLLEAGADFAIIGHSERRQYFGETDRKVLERATKAVEKGLTAIVCIGETLAERDEGRELAVCERQLSEGVLPLGADAILRTVVAYEPVWAIGTGRTASAAEAERMHAHIRGFIAANAGRETAEAVRILYGGSVKPANTSELLGMPDIDGALVGGASLDAKTFASVVRFRV